MQVPSVLKHSVVSLPPLYQWPQPVKRIILGGTIALCVGIYLLLVAGVFSAVALTISALAG